MMCYPKMNCIKKNKIVFFIGLCILLALNVIAVCVLLDDGVETLPPANGSPINISFQYEATDENGRFAVVGESFKIPMDAELFAEFSSLLAGLKLYPCDSDQEIDFRTSRYSISYISGSNENYQGVFIWFNESDDYIRVLINASRDESSSSEMVYKVEDMEAWRNEFYKLVQKSEEYKVD